ncbi:MAG: HAD hydrolase-like protein [Bacteroidota bacterium]
MPSKTFLLFDIDGTLLFSNAIDSRCFADSYEQVFGNAFPTIDWRQYPHVTDHVIFRTVFTQHFERKPTAAERDRFETHYLDQLNTKRLAQPERFREVPGAAHCWQQLAADPRFVLGIATGGWRAPAHVKLRHVGIPIPPHAGYANNMERREDILQAAIDSARAAHDIDRIVYFGDAVWDVTTTQNMGIPLIGIRRKGDTQLMTDLGVSHVFSDYLDQQAIHAAIANSQVVAQVVK